MCFLVYVYIEENAVELSSCFRLLLTKHRLTVQDYDIEHHYLHLFPPAYFAIINYQLVIA